MPAWPHMADSVICMRGPTRLAVLYAYVAPQGTQSGISVYACVATHTAYVAPAPSPEAAVASEATDPSLE